MTAAVLGTEITELEPSDRPVLVCSDLHVQTAGGPVLGHLAAWLLAAEVRRARVLVLGDLFDSYVSPAQLRVGAYRAVVERLATAVRRGVELVLLRGNRDFLLGAEIERATGGRLLAGGLRCQLDGRRALLLHGDELCLNDLPYQRAKKWLRRRWTRALARRLPLRTAQWVAERARRRSQAMVQTGDPMRFDPTAAALAAAFGSGCELLVFGHIHRPARGRWVGPPGGEYCILPAFDAGGTGLCADGDGLCYAHAAERGLETVADPDPRTFP